jgi:malate dehydrogenase (oxaloacetate-decarboxylating)(NADP+)
MTTPLTEGTSPSPRRRAAGRTDPAIRRQFVEHAGHLRLGTELLHDPRRNKGTAFTVAERDALRLRGLLPPHVFTEAEQAARALANIRGAQTDLERYVALVALQDRNETLFFRVLIDHLAELMPIIYTPTVGEACQKYGHIFRRPRGLFVSADDRGRMAEVLANWPAEDVRVIVVTDGERILGLGDLGANGMGIPVGKLDLYTACAGVDPTRTLPITLDAGTNNDELLADPYYIGLRRYRLAGDEYEQFVAEFVEAVQERWPRVLLQFEDFANHNAFRLLQRWRDRLCCFNDDIQGTAAVALAGILGSLRVTGGALADHRLLFLGAGSAGIGIADLVVDELVEGGMDREAARRHCWFFDSQGLVVADRTHLSVQKQRYAHAQPFTDDLLVAVAALRPTALIGVSGRPQAFTQPVVAAMAANHARPLVFALSNPTSKAECTAGQAYAWSQGRALFASGSPFAPVELAGRTFVPGQGNNAYVFPGVGLGVVASGATRVTDEMFRAAARELAQQATEADLETGCLYPQLSRIRDVSAAIAAGVADVAWARGLTAEPRPADVLAHVRAQVWEPVYESYVG